jgi:hypothetical protein
MVLPVNIKYITYHYKTIAMQKENISRKQFLAQTSVLSAGLFLNLLPGKTQSADKKIKVAIIGCGSGECVRYKTRPCC